jgi:DNA-directed RNA polymerase specialized sigma24 family protein
MPLSALETDRARTAFLDLYAAHFDVVWRFAIARGVSQSALDQVVVETFRLAQALVAEDAERAAGEEARVAGIARTVVREHLRRAGPAQIPSFGTGSLEAWEDLEPIGPVAEKSPCELLAMLLADMTELESEVFILCEMEGMSPASVAQVLTLEEQVLLGVLDTARQTYNLGAARLRAQQFWGSREGGLP